MRKTHLFGLILTSLIALVSLNTSDTYAACGGSWYSSSCTESPYCVGGQCGVDAGVKAVEQSVGGQITSKGISAFAQDIVMYLMSFVSLVAVIYIIYAGFQLMIGA